MNRISSRYSTQGAGSRRLPFFTALAFAALFAGCTKKDSAQSPLVSQGRIAYQTNCIACHNTDPRKPGSLGPEVFGSSRELLAARILHAEYPPGYAPKRSTKTMTALPHLKDQIDAIHAYLNANSSLMSSSSKETPAP